MYSDEVCKLIYGQVHLRSHPPRQKYIFPFEALLPRRDRFVRARCTGAVIFSLSSASQQVLRRVAVARVDKTPQSIKCFQTWPPSERFDVLITDSRRTQMSHSYAQGSSIMVAHFFSKLFNILRVQKNFLTRDARAMAFNPQRFAQLQLFTA